MFFLVLENKIIKFLADFPVDNGEFFKILHYRYSSFKFTVLTRETFYIKLLGITASLFEIIISELAIISE